MLSLNKFFTNLNFFLILLLPIFFFSRSSLLNIIIFLICSIFLLKFSINRNFFYNGLIIFSLFLGYILISALFKFGLNNFIQNISILRFPLLAMAITAILIELNDTQFKILKRIILLAVLFFCLNLLIQFIFYKDIFGVKPYPDGCETLRECSRFTGLYSRPVAGTYISYLGSILIILYSRSKYILLFYPIFFFFILLSGDRSPLITFSLFSLFSIFFLDIGRYKKFLIYLSLISILIFSLVYLKHINSRHFVLFKNLITNQSSNNNSVNQINNFKGILLDKVSDSEWGPLYSTAIQIFKDYPIFGSGHRSFRTICANYKDPINNKLGYGCSTHPHNLYLEVLAEQGIFGFAILILFIFSFIYNTKYCLHKKNTAEKQNFIMISILILSVFFPFRPFGAFLTTWNTSLLFYCIGFYGLYFKKIK
jgi:O-antigen ligase